MMQGLSLPKSCVSFMLHIDSPTIICKQYKRKEWGVELKDTSDPKVIKLQWSLSHCL